MITVITILLAIVFIALCFSVYLNIRLGKNILTIEDQVEESLDMLDTSYQRIAEIAQMPVMSDDPFIRDVLMRIRAARDSILMIANKLVVFERETTQEIDEHDTN